MYFRPTMKAPLLALLTFGCAAAFGSDLHERIDTALENIVSSDKKERAGAAEFLRGAPAEFRQRMTKAFVDDAEMLARSLPKQIDEYTSVSGILVVDGAVRIFYAMHLEPAKIGAEEKSALRTELLQQTVNQVCTMPGAAVYLLYGNALIRGYFFDNGEFLVESRITWDDCQSR